MSATIHNDLITYNPETIPDLEAAIKCKIEKGRELSHMLFNIHRWRVFGISLDPPAWVIRQQLQELLDELELDLSELDRRRI